LPFPSDDSMRNRQLQSALHPVLLSDTKIADGKRLGFLHEHFLVLYEKYQKAKKKNGPVIWAKAVLCRKYLQKIADSDKEADIFAEMFAGEKPAESFRELCEDSKSYPRKSLRPPLPPETISLPAVD